MSKRDEYATKLKQTIDERNEKISELEAKKSEMPLFIRITILGNLHSKV